MTTKTPRTDAYQDSIYEAEILKHPIREFKAAMGFAAMLEKELADLRYAQIEHDTLGCPTTKTGIYACMCPPCRLHRGDIPTLPDFKKSY